MSAFQALMELSLSFSIIISAPSGFDIVITVLIPKGCNYYNKEMFVGINPEGVVLFYPFKQFSIIMSALQALIELPLSYFYNHISPFGL